MRLRYGVKDAEHDDQSPRGVVEINVLLIDRVAKPRHGQYKRFREPDDANGAAV